MNAKIEIKDINVESANVRFYSFSIDDDTPEFLKFLSTYKNKPEYKNDFGVILARIKKILEDSANDRHFRYEGTCKDRVRALPAYCIDTSRLRLYCLKISNEIVILGNGGIKKVKTYQENPFLNDCVAKLQAIDTYLQKGQRLKTISVKGTALSGNMIFMIKTK